MKEQLLEWIEIINQYEDIIKPQQEMWDELENGEVRIEEICRRDTIFYIRKKDSIKEDCIEVMEIINNEYHYNRECDFSFESLIEHLQEHTDYKMNLKSLKREERLKKIINKNRYDKI